jgi:hypothetical protein
MDSLTEGCVAIFSPPDIKLVRISKAGGVTIGRVQHLKYQLPLLDFLPTQFAVILHQAASTATQW